MTDYLHTDLADGVLHARLDDGKANALSHGMIEALNGMLDEAEKEAAKARMISWKEELKTNPDAPPPTPPGGMNVVQ